MYIWCFIIAIDTCIFIMIHVAYRIASYFPFIFSLQIACWIAFILYVCQLGLGILRFIRNRSFWVFRVKNHDFTSKKSYFFHLRREARKFLGYFVWKITILRQKIVFFSILGGARAGCAHPPLDPPLHCMFFNI
jgi:hypothetical protein